MNISKYLLEYNEFSLIRRTSFFKIYGGLTSWQMHWIFIGIDLYFIFVLADGKV